jgi:hypothetical protein
VTHDFLLVFGVSGEVYLEAKDWLDANPSRRLVFIEERETSFPLDDRRVKTYLLESPLQIEPIAKKVAWSAVFLEAKIRVVRDLECTQVFKAIFEETHLAAQLLLSDAAEWGAPFMRNLRKQMGRPVRSALHLKNAFKDVPALIIGAGPSLKKNGHLLESFQDKALLLAGGSALNSIEVEPHFAASIDANAPYHQFKQGKFWETPFCMQSRMNPDNFSLVQGEVLLAPDSHFAFLNWLTGTEETFNGGWTVGNFLMALAVHFGCNPIVFVGMDLCYSDGKKYAHLDSDPPDGLIANNGVLTQRDWLMATRWTEELASRHPTTCFINATEGGVGFKSPVIAKRLQDVNLPTIGPLGPKVHRAIQSIPRLTQEGRWEMWEKSLKKLEILCTLAIEGEEVDMEEEIAYEKLLAPLWQIWRPIFERELDLDPHPDKLRLNQLLFFQQVLQEHLR